MQVFGFISWSLSPLTKAAKFTTNLASLELSLYFFEVRTYNKMGAQKKGAYFTSGRTHMTHTTVRTQQFQTSAVSFGSFLDASLTTEKTTEQTSGGEKLGVETWLWVEEYPVESSSCGAFTDGATTEGKVHSEI